MAAIGVTSERYRALASDATIEKTARALRTNGFAVVVAADGTAAARTVRELIPGDAEVMDMTSATLSELGISEEIVSSGRYGSLRNRLASMDETYAAEKRRLGAAPEWGVGSVHAITEDGQLLVASATGSQLPAYVYGARHVVWVAGTQKIVRNLDEGFNRIIEYVYPLEDKRSMKVYGTHSGVNKLLVINREVVRDRCTVVLVRERLGY